MIAYITNRIERNSNKMFGLIASITITAKDTRPREI